MHRRMPRMVDVARLAGVSVATVSRVLSTPEIVSADARERVEAAVRDTGYRMNAVARSLRSQRSGAVLVLIPDIDNPFFSTLLRGIEEEAQTLDLSVLIGNTAGDPEREENYLRTIGERRADGLILLTGRIPGRARADRILPPTVVAAERIDATLPTVRVDNAAAARMAVEHLIALGHRRIAHIAGPPGNVLTAERLEGYRAALAAADLPDGPVRNGTFTIPSGFDAATALQELDPKVSAIFASNDEMAVGAIQAAKARGLDVPLDLSVVGFDDIPYAGAYDPALTTIRQPRFEIGRTAMRSLGRLLADGDEGASMPSDEVLPVELIIRGSTGPT